MVDDNSQGRFVPLTFECSRMLSCLLNYFLKWLHRDGFPVSCLNKVFLGELIVPNNRLMRVTTFIAFTRNGILEDVKVQKVGYPRAFITIIVE